MFLKINGAAKVGWVRAARSTAMWMSSVPC